MPAQDDMSTAGAQKKAPPSTLQALIDKVRASFVENTALSIRIGELGKFREEFLKEMLDANPSRFDEFFSGLTKVPPKASAKPTPPPNSDAPDAKAKKGAKPDSLKPDKVNGPAEKPAEKKPKAAAKPRATKTKAPDVPAVDAPPPAPATTDVPASSPTPEKKRSRSGDAGVRERHPMDYARVSKNFTTEVCTPKCTTQVPEDGRVTNGVGMKEHLVCTHCGDHFHTRRPGTYYQHLTDCLNKDKPKKDEGAHVTKGHIGTVKQFVRDVVVISSSTPMGDTALCKFVWDYESKRPPVSSAEILKDFPKSAKGLVKYHEGIVHVLLEEICRIVDECTLFGVAVDGGVDPVKHEHILIMVMYVLEYVFILPPLYHPTKAAWNGEVMAKEMMNSLTSMFGEKRVVKMRYLMVDGLRVNHCARVEAEGMMKTILESLKAPGSTDWENFRLTSISLLKALLVCLPCTGHLIDNVATDGFSKWETTFLFQFKRAFRNIFYGSGINHKPMYGTIALDEHLAAFGEQGEAVSALKRFERHFPALSSIKFGPDEKLAARTACSVALKSLEEWCAVAKRMNAAVCESHEQTFEAWKVLYEELKKELHEKEIAPVIKAPQHGGVTRWTYSKYRSIKFIVTQHAVILKFLKQEAAKKDASVSMKEALRLLTDNDIVEQGKLFLEETHLFCEILTQFSDPSEVCTSTHVARALNRLCELKDRPEALVPSYVQTAIKHHLDRVKETANLSFFYFVQWLDVEFVTMAQLTKVVPPTVDKINGIFGSGKIFDISQEDWNEYLDCPDFNFVVGQDERTWWKQTGSNMFPAVWEAARHALYVPAVVLACDQLMSTLMTRYNVRHGQLNPETIQAQVFIRANRKYLIKMFDEELERSKE